MNSKNELVTHSFTPVSHRIMSSSQSCFVYQSLFGMENTWMRVSWWVWFTLDLSSSGWQIQEVH